MSTISYPIQDMNTLSPFVPIEQIQNQSICFNFNDINFIDCSKKNFSDCYQQMQKICKTWNQHQVANQSLIYSKINFTDPYKLNLSPYPVYHSWIQRVFQHIQLWWKILFGGTKISQEEVDNQNQHLESILKKQDDEEIKEIHEVMPPANNQYLQQPDPNWRTSLIKQRIYHGRKVDIFLDSSSIKSHGLPRHFLIIPKKGSTNFADVSSKEYRESMKLAQFIIKYFNAKSPGKIKNVTLINKLGMHTDQKIPQWHLHVIFHDHEISSFWEKIVEMKNVFYRFSHVQEKDSIPSIKSLKKKLKQSQYTPHRPKTKPN